MKQRIMLDVLLGTVTTLGLAPLGSADVPMPTGSETVMPTESDEFSSTAFVKCGGSDDALRLVHNAAAAGSRSSGFSGETAEAWAAVQSTFSLVSRAGHGLFSGDEFSRRMCVAEVSAYGNRFGLFGSRGYDGVVEVMGDVTTVLSESQVGLNTNTLLLIAEASDSVSARTIDRADFSVGPTAVRLKFTACNVEAGIQGILSCSSLSPSAILDTDLRANPGKVIVSSTFLDTPPGSFRTLLSQDIELGELRAHADIEAGPTGVTASVPFEWDAVEMDLDLQVQELVAVDGGTGTGGSSWSTIEDRNFSDVDRSGGSGLIEY